LENKKKKRNPLPLAGLNPAHARGRFPLPRPRPPPPAHLPAHSALAPAPTNAPSPLVSPAPSPTLAVAPTGRLAPLVSRHSLALALARGRFRWRAGPTGQPLHRPRRVRLRRGRLRPPSSPHPLAAQRSSALPRPRRLTASLPGIAPAVRSRRRRCAALIPALCTSPASAELRRSPPLGRL
jgi:hypothetical protein